VRPRPVQTVWSAEHMSVVDELRVQLPFPIFDKHRLAIVGVLAADIDQPRKPEGAALWDTGKVAPGQDLE